MIQNEINNLTYLIEAASRKKMKIILNPSPFEEKLLQTSLDTLYFIILNEQNGGDRHYCCRRYFYWIFCSRALPEEGIEENFQTASAISISSKGATSSMNMFLNVEDIDIK